MEILPPNRFSNVEASRAAATVKNKLWISVGLLFIALGLTLNQWVIAAMTIPEGVIVWTPYKIAIWLLEIVLILASFIIIRYRKTDFPKLILVSSISLIIVLIMLEFLLRLVPIIFHTSRPDYKRAGIFYEFQRSTQYHPRWGWSFVPNIDTVWEEDWRARERATIRTSFRTLPIPGYSEYGMRDDGLNADAEAVIPVFGDSFTFGSTVELEEIWSELIEQRNPDIDMLNLASGGGLTKAVEQYDILRDRLPSHDIIIYQMWLGNEFFDNYAFPKELGDFDDLERAHIARTQQVRLQAASYLAYVAIEAIDNVQKRLMPDQNDLIYVPETNQLWDDVYGNFYLYPENPMLVRYTEPSYTDERIVIGIENTEAALLRMKSLLGERKLIIILFPFKAQLYDEIFEPHRPELDLTKPNKIIMDLCQRHDITCFDLLPMLKRYRSEKPFWDYDPHFTKVGQFYASIEIEAMLKQLDIIPAK